MHPNLYEAQEAGEQGRGREQKDENEAADDNDNPQDTNNIKDDNVLFLPLRLTPKHGATHQRMVLRNGEKRGETNRQKRESLSARKGKRKRREGKRKGVMRTNRDGQDLYQPGPKG